MTTLFLYNFRTILILLIIFSTINFLYIRKSKKFTIDKKNLWLYNILFILTTSIHYLLNTKYYGKRLDFISKYEGSYEVFIQVIKAHVIHPYLNVLVIVLIILSIMLFLNRTLKLGSSNYFDNWKVPLRISILSAYFLFWIFYTLIDFFKYGIR